MRLLMRSPSLQIGFFALFFLVPETGSAVPLDRCGTIAPNGLSTICVASKPTDWVYNAGGQEHATQAAADASLTRAINLCGAEELTPGAWSDTHYVGFGQTVVVGAELSYTITTRHGPDCEEERSFDAVVMTRTRTMICPPGFRYATTSGGSRTLLVCGRFADRSSTDYGQNLGKPCTEKGQCTAGNPINLTNGNKFQNERDFAGFGQLPLHFERHYNSLAQLGDTINGVYAFRRSVGYGGGGGALSAVDLFNEPDRRALAIGSVGMNWRHSYHRALQITKRFGITFAAIYRHDGAVYNVVLEHLDANGDPITVDAVNVGPNFQISQGTDQQTGDDVWRIKTPDNEVETYSAEGRLIAIEDENGNTITLTYDEAGRLDLVADQFGRTLTFGYAVDPVPGQDYTATEGLLNQITSMNDPSGDLYEYHYDNANGGLLTRVDYPDGTSRTYHYEDASFPYALTGISIHATGSMPVAQDRYATWGYDSEGRANLSYHGTAGDITDRVDIQYFIDTHGSLFANSWFNEYATVTESAGTPEQWVRQYSIEVVQTASRVTQIAEGPTIATANGAPDPALTVTRAFAYTDTAEVESVTNARGIVTRYEYTQDDRRLRSAVIEAYQTAEERRTEIEWHTQFELPRTIRRPSVNNPGGWHTTQISYEPDQNSGGDSRRVQSIVETGTDYDGSAISRTTSFTYNAFGRLASLDGPLPGSSDTTTFNYYVCATGSECGELSSVVNALGHTTTYDAYDADGRVTRIVDANGISTDYQYDGLGRLAHVTETPAPGSGLAPRTTTVVYNDYGLPISSTDGAGISLAYSFDSAMNLTLMSRADGDQLEFAHDSRGNAIYEARKRPDGTTAYWMNRRYDEDGRLIKTQSPSVGSLTDDWEFNFDINGLHQWTDDPLTQYSTYHTTYDVYDALGRLRQMTDPDGTIAFSYDEQDRIETVTAANGASTQYFYDDFGRLRQELSPDRGTLVMTYDDADNLVFRTDGTGRTASYSYDGLYRLTELVIDRNVLSGGVEQNGFDRYSFNYDETATSNNAIGRLTSATAIQDSSSATPEIEYRYQYDGFGRQSDEVLCHASASCVYKSMTYDSGDRVETISNGTAASIAFSSARTEVFAYRYSFDLNGDVSGITDVSAGASTAIASNITYAPFGPRREISFGSSASQLNSKAYDQRYRMTSIGVYPQYPSSSQSFGKNMTWGATDNLLYAGASDLFGLNHVYSYDRMNRLTTDSKAWYEVEEYDYFSNGNRRSFQEEDYESGENNESLTYTYETTQSGGASNRLESVTDLLAWNPTTDTFTLDAAGQTTGSTRYGMSGPYVYDALGQMRQYTEEWHYGFNQFGERAVKRQVTSGNSDSLILFTYDGAGQLVTESEYVENGSSYRLSQQRHYVWLANEPVALSIAEFDATGAVIATNTFYIHTDQINTPTVLTDDSGAIAWRWIEKTAFGKGYAFATAGAIAGPVNLRFAGQYYDAESSLNYNYYRTLDPATGRYLESDPIGLDGGLNTYAYVGGNPLSQIDPKGLAANAVIGGGIRIIGGRAAGTAIGNGLRRIAGPTIGSVLGCALVFDRCSNVANSIWGPFPNPDTDADDEALADPNASGDSDRARRCREVCSEIALPGEARFRNCLRDCMRRPEDFGCD